MSMKHLGPSFDIHTGGVDLIFPHHEDEIAQSEAATGQPFVGTWLHCAHLQMGGEKMAKSVGNIARVGDLLARGVSARALRYALIAVHYRAALNYTDASLAAAGAAVDRSTPCSPRWPPTARTGPPTPPSRPAGDDRAGFERALDDDLNISAALAALFDLVRELNRRIDARSLSTADAGRGILLATSTASWGSGRTPSTTGSSPSSRRCSRRAPPREPRGTGRNRTASAMSSPGRGSSSRTRATASAGVDWRISMADGESPKARPKRVKPDRPRRTTSSPSDRWAGRWRPAPRRAAPWWPATGRISSGCPAGRRPAPAGRRLRPGPAHPARAR